MSSSRQMKTARASGPQTRGFRRNKGVAKVADLLLIAGLVCLPPAAGGLFLWRQASAKAAHVRIEVGWRAAQAPMVARLKQAHPLEYGDVWATHGGVTCGFVNGWGSFGGLSAMTPFYVWKNKPFFAPDISVLDFAPGWRECLGDHWVDLVRDGRPVARR